MTREVGGEIDEPDDAEQSDPSELEFDDLMTTATAASTDSSRAETRTVLMSELALVDEMLDVAEASRYDADPRVRKIIDWIEANMCRGLSAPGATPPQWNDRRLLIFTEYEDTRRWLQRCLNEAIAHSDRASERIAVFTGMTSRHRREDIKHAFNTEPGDHPLRILIATDAAREGLNLQRHCHDLFHFDLPWNPSRLDQRNGRIDRKLQPADEVFCRYFVYSQRPRGPRSASIGEQGRTHPAGTRQRREGPRGACFPDHRCTRHAPRRARPTCGLHRGSIAQ